MLLLANVVELSLLMMVVVVVWSCARFWLQPDPETFCKYVAQCKHLIGTGASTCGPLELYFGRCLFHGRKVHTLTCWVVVHSLGRMQVFNSISCP